VSESVRSEGRNLGLGAVENPKKKKKTTFKEKRVVVTFGDQNVKYAVKFSLFLSSFQASAEGNEEG
jgi:hypothetical protein